MPIKECIRTSVKLSKALGLRADIFGERAVIFIQILLKVGSIDWNTEGVYKFGQIDPETSRVLTIKNRFTQEEVDHCCIVCSGIFVSGREGVDSVGVAHRESQ